jgi:glycosyltransferase involved in cell wall biosynthesis
MKYSKKTLLSNLNRIGEGGLRSRKYSKKPSIDKPLISIITVVFNGENDIEAAILSVINQTYQNIEYIIIDGGSNDGTLDIIKKYDYAIDYWVSEPDNGIFDAMNKGVELSNGEWVLFLGSDDCIYSPDTFSKIFKKFNSKCKLLYGNIVYSDKKVVKSKFNKLILFKNTIHHQSAFYHKELFRSFKYSPVYKMLSDYELNLRIYKLNIESEKINRIIANCGRKGISNRVLFRGYKEEILIRKEYIKQPLLLVILNIQTILRYFYKKFAYLFRCN